MRAWVCGALCLIFAVGATWSSTQYPFDTAKQEAQFDHLLRELRCLVCQNQDLVDSHAPLANDLRQEVYQRVLSGQTDSEIIHELTARYGDFILFNPPLKSITALLWFGPALFLLIGLLVFGFNFIKRKQHD